MKLIRLLATAMAGAATLVLARRLRGRRRARARSAGRAGGARRASAPRLFAARAAAGARLALPCQRINLGLFAVLGELSATADWRAISEEIWPFTHGPAATPIGEAEAPWRARRPAMAA